MNAQEWLNMKLSERAFWAYQLLGGEISSWTELRKAAEQSMNDVAKLWYASDMSHQPYEQEDPWALEQTAWAYWRYTGQATKTAVLKFREYGIQDPVVLDFGAGPGMSTCHLAAEGLRVVYEDASLLFQKMFGLLSKELRVKQSTDRPNVLFSSECFEHIRDIRYTLSVIDRPGINFAYHRASWRSLAPGHPTTYLNMEDAKIPPSMAALTLNRALKIRGWTRLWTDQYKSDQLWKRKILSKHLTRGFGF